MKEMHGEYLDRNPMDVVEKIEATLHQAAQFSLENCAKSFALRKERESSLYLDDEDGKYYRLGKSYEEAMERIMSVEAPPKKASVHTAADDTSEKSEPKPHKEDRKPSTKQEPACHMTYKRNKIQKVANVPEEAAQNFEKDVVKFEEGEKAAELPEMTDEEIETKVEVVKAIDGEATRITEEPQAVGEELKVNADELPSVGNKDLPQNIRYVLHVPIQIDQYPFDEAKLEAIFEEGSKIGVTLKDIEYLNACKMKYDMPNITFTDDMAFAARKAMRFIGEHLKEFVVMDYYARTSHFAKETGATLLSAEPAMVISMCLENVASQYIGCNSEAPQRAMDTDSNVNYLIDFDTLVSDRFISEFYKMYDNHIRFIIGSYVISRLFSVKNSVTNAAKVLLLMVLYRDAFEIRYMQDDSYETFAKFIKFNRRDAPILCSSEQNYFNAKFDSMKAEYFGEKGKEVFEPLKRTENGTYCVLDTCICTSAFKDETLMRYYREGARFVITDVVLSELVKLETKPTAGEREKNAARAFIMMIIKHADLFEFEKIYNRSAKLNDDHIITFCEEYGKNHNVVLLTSDVYMCIKAEEKGIINELLKQNEDAQTASNKNATPAAQTATNKSGAPVAKTTNKSGVSAAKIATNKSTTPEVKTATNKNVMAEQPTATEVQDAQQGNDETALQTHRRKIGKPVYDLGKFISNENGKHLIRLETNDSLSVVLYREKKVICQQTTDIRPNDKLIIINMISPTSFSVRAYVVERFYSYTKIFKDDNISIYSNSLMINAIDVIGYETAIYISNFVNGTL